MCIDRVMFRLRLAGISGENERLPVWRGKADGKGGSMRKKGKDVMDSVCISGKKNRNDGVGSGRQ